MPDICSKFNCSICGDEENPLRLTHGVRLASEKLCFTCDHWLQIANESAQQVAELLKTGKVPERKRFVADGVLYSIGKEPTDAEYREGKMYGRFGFGGQKFIIEFDSGAVITSRNLWYGGAVPDRFRDIFPDTAKLRASQSLLADQIPTPNKPKVPKVAGAAV